MMRKYPMWRKRERNYVWTPDRSDKRYRHINLPDWEIDEVMRELAVEDAWKKEQARRRGETR